MIRRDVRRRLEQYAANPECEANVLSAVHDIPMDRVALEVGLEPKFGQSPFAIRRGQIFERSLFEEEALRLRKALIDQKVLPANASGFVDLRTQKNGGLQPTLDASRQAFLELLKGFAAATGDARQHLPAVIASPGLAVPGRAILPDGLFAVDVLTVHPQPPPGPIYLRVGEIKVYPDRGGFTSSTELASTRAQAGLYLHVLRRELTELGVSGAIEASVDGFLVLTRPGSNQPSVRAPEDLRFQAARAESAFERLREAAARAVPPDINTKEVPRPRLELIAQAGKRYGDRCLAFCELADHCHARALAAGSASALGEDVARLLGEIRLHRALELLRGADALTPAETDFQRRVVQGETRRVPEGARSGETGPAQQRAS
jgi:hypothetical protein